MKTETEKRNEFFDLCHKQNVDYTTSRYLWDLAKKMGARGDDKPEGMIDGVVLARVDRTIDGRVHSVDVVQVEDTTVSTLFVPKTGGPRPLTDLGPVFEAIQDSGVKSGDLGITRLRASTIVAALQDAGIKFYTE